MRRFDDLSLTFCQVKERFIFCFNGFLEALLVAGMYISVGSAVTVNVSLLYSGTRHIRYNTIGREIVGINDGFVGSAASGAYCTLARTVYRSTRTRTAAPPFSLPHEILLFICNFYHTQIQKKVFLNKVNVILVKFWLLKNLNFKFK